MRFIILCLLLLAGLVGPAQTTLYDSVNQRHDKISKAGLIILSGWSAASVVSGLIGQSNTTGDQKYFYKRNILWGSINLGFSGLGLLRLHLEKGRTYTPAETFKRMKSAERVFLFNAGLDLAYVAYGLYTRERAFRYIGDKYDRLRGTGNSLLLQGGFLTLFDGISYLLHKKAGDRLDVKLQNLSFASTPDGLGLVYRF